MMYVDHIHGLKEFFVPGLVAQGQVKARVRKRQAGTAKDPRFVILVFFIPKRKYINLVPCTFEGTFIQVDIICDTAYIRLVCIQHHSNTHESIVQFRGVAVKTPDLFQEGTLLSQIRWSGILMGSSLMVESHYEEPFWLNWFCVPRNMK